MSARQRILDRLRAAPRPAGALPLQVSGEPALVARTADLAPGALIDSFCRHAAGSGVEVLRPADRTALRAALQARLEGRDAVHIDPAVLEEFPELPSASEAAVFDMAVLAANAGIAETGTVCVHSGDVASRDLFLCEHLILVLQESRIVPDPETWWRAQSDHPRRAVHFITGPSRTADVEQTIQIGAHGPVEVTLIVY